MKKRNIFFSLLLAVIVLGIAINGERLQRLYYTLTLFDEDKIVYNFSNMINLYGNNIAEIKTSTPASSFLTDNQPLPLTFNYKGVARNVSEFLEETSTTGLLVLKNDTITFEKYYQGTQADDYRVTWSVAKSFLSALFGIAVHDGQIDIQEPVTKYVPLLIGSGYDNVRVKDVLQMSSGVGFNEDYGDFNSDINRFGRAFALGGSLDEFATSLVREKEPGSFLHYVSIDTHVLGMVLRAATGLSIVDYFEAKLWSKIQPESSVYYMIDNYDEPMVLGGMNVRTRDMARVGQLYLNNGLWNGVQVVPSEWVKDSITPDAPHLIPGERITSDLNMGYGYQWWIPENADQEFMALGIYGQFIYINQKAGVVIVKNSANVDFMDNDYESTDVTVELFRSIVETL